MFKYDKNFKLSKKVRINDSDDQGVSEYVSKPVHILKNTHDVPTTERPNRRHINDNYRKSRNDRDSSEESHRYEDSTRRNYKKRSYFNPLLGDNFVDRKFARTYVYYRPPFDWYKSNRYEILDEYEEILMPEKPIYSRQYSDGSVYDRLDRYDYHQKHETPRSRRKKEPIYESDSDRKKRNGIRKKEVITEREYEIEEENMFAFSDSENRSPNNRLNKKRDNLEEVVENFNDISIDERKKYRKPYINRY